MGQVVAAAPKFKLSSAVAFLSGDRKVIKYFLAGRQAFHRNVQFLGAAVDASRVARKKVLVTVLTQPSNLCFWAPPQALCVNWAQEAGSHDPQEKHAFETQKLDVMVVSCIISNT